YTGFWGTLTAEDRLKVEEAASLVGITPLLRRMVHTLSDGERQKVMIAKALAQETPVIFLDEPTAFLDFPSKIEMMQLLWRLSRQTHKTIFLSTHDLDLALQIADRVWLMDREQGITVGTPEDLTLDGRLARFFQRKGMAFNSANGLYEVAYQFRTSIRLMGAEQPVRMVAKALRRNGVASGSTIASERWIEATAEGFRLHEPDGTVCHFSTIDQLLQALRPLFQQIASDIE
ncbi:MAG: ABC transporter ATP-binding protein, partial [Parabacteroides sp.]|nr:ABC transporter ATP-binding protein [Parabacteroides sp.]